jgi:hypothetical protein
MQVVSDSLSPGPLPRHGLYYVLYMGFIIFFTYFYTAIIFNPNDLADNMKKYGGFIPGVRPGKRTSEYIDRVLTRITLPGAMFWPSSPVPGFLIRSSTSRSTSAHEPPHRRRVAPIPCGRWSRTCWLTTRFLRRRRRSGPEMRIVLLGRTGAGKGRRRLAARWSVP